MGSCCSGQSRPRFRGPGKVLNLTAIQDANTGSVTLYWLAPTYDGDQVTSYDIRFKASDEAHYKYLTPVGVGSLQNSSDNLYQLSITVGQSDGLTPLTRCNFEVRARIHDAAGGWNKVVYFVEWSCRLPGCFTSRLRLSHSHIYPFCSRDHGKQCAMQCCLFRECQEVKSREDGPQYHFCKPIHLRLAKIESEEFISSTGIEWTYRQIQATMQTFQEEMDQGTSPVIQSILEIVNPAVEERFKVYTDNLPRFHRKVDRFFHGTTLSCNILEHLVICCDHRPLSQCGLCGIVKYGFEITKSSNNWQRYGPGFYLSSKSSKAGDYCRGRDASRAVILCDVAPGKRYELKNDNPRLAEPPANYHSVYGKSKFLGAYGDLNSEEIVLYSSGAICPRYVFVFRVI